MKLYELAYLITPEITEEEAEKVSDKIAEELKGKEAVLCKIESPKKRFLAYEINGYKEAYLASISFDISSEKVSIIKDELSEKSEIVRSVVFSKKMIEEEEEDTIKEKPTKDESPKEEEDKKENKETKKEKSKKTKKVKLKEIDEKIDEII